MFKVLVEREIRFCFETMESGLQGMNPIAARYGGSFGQAAQVRVFVHPDDLSNFHTVFKEHFIAEPETPDWRDKLRER